MLRQRPCHVLAHQFTRMFCMRLQRSDHFGTCRRITERHRNIAQPSFVADTANHRSGMPVIELRFVPCKQLDQRGAIESVAYIEVGQLGRACKLVPRANELTLDGWFKARVATALLFVPSELLTTAK